MSLSATTLVETIKASGYLQQLCKHFGHKVKVEFTPDAGWIKFEFGRVDLEAINTSLNITVSSDTQEHLSKLKSVVISHLERFAFRENLEINWDN